METADVVVIGGGVIGCAIAYFLRKQQVDVMLFERDEIGGQASGAAAGLLAPLGPLSGPGLFADLVLAGFSCLSDLLPELEDASGIQTGFERTGALRTVRNPKRVAHLRKRMEQWQPLGLELHWLNGEEARRREPLLAPDICGAVYVPAEAQVQATYVVQAFARAAAKMGAHIRSHQEVHYLLKHSARVTEVHTKQGARVRCNHIVLASGAWAAQCEAWLGTIVPVQPLHGQLLALSCPSRPLQQIIFGEGGYLVPRGDSVLVGATREEVGFDTRVTQQGIDWLCATAVKLVPELVGSTIQRSWSGLRPRTPDSHPIVGFLAPWENVLVAAGHNSVGIILSAITGQSIVEMIITGEVPFLMQPFEPARFSSDKKPATPLPELRNDDNLDVQ